VSSVTDSMGYSVWYIGCRGGRVGDISIQDIIVTAAVLEWYGMDSSVTCGEGWKHD
jgi:hypothetical protein